ncbi:MAG: helix-turn-helix domain-containing protein [Oscillospiraceae bacterium]|nr:helix-turn-helix domain-containing protein [Oscillospiraceae bacterium]
MSKELGKVLYAVLQRNLAPGMTIASLEKAAKCSEGTVRKMKIDGSIPRADALHRLANVLGTTSDELMRAAMDELAKVEQGAEEAGVIEKTETFHNFLRTVELFPDREIEYRKGNERINLLPKR